MHSSTTLAALALYLTLTTASPAPKPNTTKDIVSLPTTTYVFPDLVPAGTVDMEEYSTKSAPCEETDLPTIMKDKRKRDDTDKEGYTPVVVTLATTTYTMPDLAPAGTVEVAQGTAAAASDIGVIMKRDDTDKEAYTPVVVTLATTTYTMPDLAPAGTVDVAQGTGAAASDIGVIMKRGVAARATQMRV